MIYHFQRLRRIFCYQTIRCGLLASRRIFVIDEQVVKHTSQVLEAGVIQQTHIYTLEIMAAITTMLLPAKTFFDKLSEWLLPSFHKIAVGGTFSTRSWNGLCQEHDGKRLLFWCNNWACRCFVIVYKLPNLIFNNLWGS